MLNFGQRQGPSPKCYFTSSTLPEFVNHDQLPTKKKPFATVLSQKFNNTLNVVLPQDRAEVLEESFVNGTGTLRYLTVYMKLGDLIEGDFFNHYIKSGNVLMLSEGRPGIDRIFSLSEGILRLEVDKQTFERIGLEGKTILSKGRKHVKARYAIELNLRLPSMVKGKSGFQRIIWAFRNVLDESVNWLFYDFKSPNDGSGVIAAHQPKVKEVKPQMSIMKVGEVPEFRRDFGEKDYEIATQLLEWLTLLIGESPRIERNDSIDAYLSRYRVPHSDDHSTDTAEQEVQDLVKFHWQGFIPPVFIQNVLLATLKASRMGWFAMNAVAFSGEAYAFIQDNVQTMTWEYED